VLKSFTVATDATKSNRIAQSINLGLIGPGAFGKEMQVKIPMATGNKIPDGWDNQIKNDIVFNYRIDFEKLLCQYNSIFAINSQATAQVGTLFTNILAGVNVSLGLLKSPFSLKKNKNEFQLYLYSQPEVSLIGYNATLQGGFFKKDSPYTIEASKVERFNAQFNYGLFLKTSKLYFE
jgi:lipid A 3-O-deacylase